VNAERRAQLMHRRLHCVYQNNINRTTFAYGLWRLFMLLVLFTIIIVVMIIIIMHYTTRSE